MDLNIWFPVFAVVDRGLNLSFSYMNKKLETSSSQFCSSASKAPWSIGSSRKSHRNLKKALKILHKLTNFCKQMFIRTLLAEAEIVWNFNQWDDQAFPHLNCFGLLPRTDSKVSNSFIQQRVAIMEMSWPKLSLKRASNLLSKVFRPYHTCVNYLKTCYSKQLVWF